MSKIPTSLLLRDNTKVMYQPWRNLDFLADEYVQAMSPIQRWMYRTLLQAEFTCNERPYLPDDDTRLWMLAGCESRAQWDAHKDAVRECFTPTVVDGDPRLGQKKVLEDWARIQDALATRRESARKAGIASAASRGRNADGTFADNQQDDGEEPTGANGTLDGTQRQPNGNQLTERNGRYQEAAFGGNPPSRDVSLFSLPGDDSNAVEAGTMVDPGAACVSSASFTSSAGNATAPASPVSSSKETPVAPGRGKGNSNPNTQGTGRENLPLIELLPKIAARELHNARGVPGNLKGKFELIETAYGVAAVASDFEAWCREHVENHFPYPIVQYVKVIDQRLGSEPEEQHANVKDPRIVELKSLAYKLTGLLPFNRAVAAVLLNYPIEEIKAALLEYTEDLPGKDAKADMHAFWADGGAEAIILARRRRNQQEPA